MSDITVLGIDLSSQPTNTAACIITRIGGDITIEAPLSKLADEGADGLHSLIERADFIGIDAPFGWPEPFRKAVAAWTLEQWNNTLREEMRFRSTDGFVLRKTDGKVRPLSVSSDLIALPAMRAMALLHRSGIMDKSGASEVGGKRFFEVYPAASLCCWDINRQGYKGKDAKARQKRGEILEAIRNQIAPAIADAYADSDHHLDALLAALTTLAAAANRTLPPTAGQEILAQQEGWIHLPQCSLAELF